MKPRILIVDDDESITKQLFWTLGDDYEVVTANDMQTAVRRITIYTPAVAILDLHLEPNTDSPHVGLRILEYIKSHFPDTKVLMMSSTGSIENRNACFAIGANEFLDKPFETEQLLAAVRRLAPRSLEFV